MTAHRDYIPGPDEEFNAFQSNYVANLTPNIGTWGILVTNPDYVDLLARQTDWVAKFAAGRKSANPTHPQIIAKQNSRKACEKSLRFFNKAHIAFNSAVTNADRAALGINIPDTVRTADPVPDYAPQGSVHKIQHQMHELRIVDPNHPDTREMPHGWHVEVWASITPPVAPAAAPANASFYFAGNASKFTFDVHWTANFGLTAYYYLVYENTHGATGPASAIFSAVIA